MKKPTANVEIIMEAKSGEGGINPYFVDFWFSTEKAKEWLAKEIPAFREDNGITKDVIYGVRDVDSTPGKGWFVVNRCFDIDEVINYLTTFGEGK